MKKVEVSVDFIKEAHQSACANWKQRIEKELPDLFNKLEVGKWYKGNVDFNSLIYITEINNDYGTNKASQINYYGFTFDKYSDSNTICNIDHEKSLTLATEEEVKTALVNEAVKRGFELGKKVKWNFEGSEGYKCSNIAKDYFEYFVNKNKLELSCGIIFDNGKWGPLITEPTEKELLGDKIKDLEKNLEEVKSLYNKL